MESQTSITGILLLGGASRRFGSPKALAPFRGRTLAEQAWDALAWCDERLALGKRDAPRLPFPVLDDGFAVQAPIAGVVAGLRRSRHDLCVFLPVDCPLLEEDDLRALAAEVPDAAVPPTGPLPGAYRRTALPVLERRLASEDLSLRRALLELETRVVELPSDHLLNVNTAADLRALVARSPRL